MDTTIHKALTDKLYDKRKAGAYELENVIREHLATSDYDRIDKIVHQLCGEYAYAVHQPHARNGGLIGLAAAAIALGPHVARYLEEIVPPVLACFTDQDARVRYYACESMYNISKVAKGEILVYFNQVFDALCKLAADPELSVKNGAELLDRLIKDIVSESASSYVSILHHPNDTNSKEEETAPDESPIAFSLAKFVPLLQDRITVLNPYTRMFLVSWITLLDSIPDLELVSYLPSFLGGLFKFLSDSNQDVHTATQVALERFLAEIRKIARLKRGLAESKRSQTGFGTKQVDSDSDEASPDSTPAGSTHGRDETDVEEIDEEAGSDSEESHTSGDGEEEWVPGQDVQVDHSQILEIMVTFLGGSSEQGIQLTALRWIDSFFEISPEDILFFVPRLLTQVLPAMSNEVEQVRIAAGRVNESLMNYILTLPDSNPVQEQPSASQSLPVFAAPPPNDRRESALSTFSASRVPRPTATGGRDSVAELRGSDRAPSTDPGRATPVETHDFAPESDRPDLDWEATVNALTLQFLNDHEATRVAALNWLIMLHRKAPTGRKLEINDGTFPALLKTLSDASEAVVTRDLLLLSQMSRNTDDPKFSTFMVNLLNLFSTDRKLLETRGNLIIRQLCVSLNPERIFRTLADCLEKEEDVEFASIMVQNLNNNLITAPELSDLRKRLRNLDSREGQAFFVALFRSWCHNAVATFSLCLLAQAYEQAYGLLQIFAELDMTVNMLIQIDKLVQLLESPVFTYLRLQLLEPERYPHLYKCLYGLLMFLPQSAAFAALKNRLNSVSAIGYLHIAPRTATTPSSTSNFGDRPTRLKARDDPVRWSDLLDKFRNTQERARRRPSSAQGMEGDTMPAPPVPEKEVGKNPGMLLLERSSGPAGTQSQPNLTGLSRPGAASRPQPQQKDRIRSSLGLGRFGSGRKAKK
ncbi:vacuole morphology and inheritance protein [Microthyrium microscopicum]|uniref:Vacuole morphology and inheritance protein n=1 Tax=Microthyrium microscopicum TaxID=703497 RepID=A0A6A6U0K3_9PEZI|nr:vacuole morphology and inheritance protein [Microthyrium microscopicum]